MKDKIRVKKSKKIDHANILAESMSSLSVREPLKIIAVGDQHIQCDNIPEVTLLLSNLEKYCQEEQPDLIVLLGDMLHTHERVHTTPLNKAYEFVDTMRKIAPVIILVGNHDYISNQQFLTSNHWLNGMKEWHRVEVADTVIHKFIKDYHLIFMPYVPPGRFIEALNYMNGQSEPHPDWSKADCIFAHQEFFGCKMGAIASVDGDTWEETYPPVISGHIHSSQTLKNVYYTGSSHQIAFGESERNTIAKIVMTGYRKYSLDEIDLGLPRKKIVYTEVSEMEDFKIPESQDKIKLTLSGCYEEFKAFKKTKKYKEIVNTGTKVVFKPKKIKQKKKDNDDPIEPEDQKAEDAVQDATNFSSILSNLIHLEKNPALYEVYEMIINDKIVDEDDVLYV